MASRSLPFRRATCTFTRLVAVSNALRNMLTHSIQKVKFYPEEEKVYKALEQESRAMFREYEKRGDDEVMRNYANILEIILRLRQVCNHKDLIGDREIKFLDLIASGKAAEIDWNDPVGKKMISILRENESEDCCICFDTLKEVTITRCCGFRLRGPGRSSLTVSSLLTQSTGSAATASRTLFTSRAMAIRRRVPCVEPPSRSTSSLRRRSRYCIRQRSSSSTILPMKRMQKKSRTVALRQLRARSML